MKFKVLYISYDGMTDPLGQSQVINYLIGLSKYGYQFDILSFEKSDKFASIGNNIKNLLEQNNIGWHPQIFHTSPPIISKVYDRYKLFSEAELLHKKNKYNIIHCRSYTAAEVGLKLKLRTGVKFLFDMRGFWADEKADGGHWDLKKIFWKKVYNFYKRKEKAFIVNADYIIALTEAAKTEIESWSFFNIKTPLAVIPCCADVEHFQITNSNRKNEARQKLNISKEKIVLSYLGSLGAWYMLDEMLLFYSKLKLKFPNSLFLIITNTKHEIIYQKLTKFNLNSNDVKILTVSFSDVPSFMYASDLSISFIKPVYSKMSSSPVKIGEVLSMGIPIVANNIGDAKIILKNNNIGEIIDDFESNTMQNVIDKLEFICKISPEVIRKVAIDNFSLKDGIVKYQEVYKYLLQ